MPPTVEAEDTTLTTGGDENTGLSSESKVSYECPDNDRRAVQPEGTRTDEEALEKELKAEQDFILEFEGGKLGIAAKGDSAADNGHERGRQEEQEEEEEEEEMTQERLQSLLEDIKLEGGSEDEEMTEERVNEILNQVRQAEKDLCSVPGWCSEMSSVKVEPATPGHAELKRPQEDR